MKKLIFTYSMFALVVGGAMVSLAHADAVPAAVAQQVADMAKPTEVSPVPTSKLPKISTAAAIKSASCLPRGDLEQWAASHIGGVVGRFSDNADLNSVLGGVTVTIPELKLSSTTCPDGTFYFPYDSGYDSVINADHPTVTVKAKLAGYGSYTMFSLPFSKDITEIITPSLDKGNKPSVEAGSLSPDERGTGLTDSATSQNGVGASGSSSSVTPLATPIYFSQTVPPPYIRIAIRQNDSNGKPLPGELS